MERHVKVGTEWKYLYRAGGSHGQTNKFMLSAKHDVSVAKRSFKRFMSADQRRPPFRIGTDKQVPLQRLIWSQEGREVLHSLCS